MPPVATPPATFPTAPLFDRCRRMTLWPSPQAHYRQLLAVVRWEDAPAALRSRLAVEECYFAPAAALETWQDKDNDANRVYAWVVLGECVTRPDMNLYPPETVEVEKAVRATLLHSRNQALQTYSVQKSEPCRLRYEQLEKRCLLEGVRP